MTHNPVADQAGIVALRPALLAGDAGAIDAWYRAEHPQVWRLCLGLLADATEADDLAQDAMLKLLDTLDRWDPARSWAAWRNTVVLNLGRDRLRRGATRARHEGAAETAALFSRPLPSPDDAARASEVREALTRALSGLTPREREAFVLVDLSGVPAAQAAEAMDVAEATVRSLLTLARRRLRTLLAAHVPGGTP
jgi:RNA polymerase sigma factor (sigma-70 family)